MAEKQQHRTPTMHGPAIYRICVRGRLDPGWSDRIGGMQITETRGPDGPVETILVGRLPDQAELSGFLKALYDLHLPVVMAECVTSENCSI
jgi:hypothetical protein